MVRERRGEIVIRCRLVVSLDGVVEVGISGFVWAEYVCVSRMSGYMCWIVVLVYMSKVVSYHVMLSRVFGMVTIWIW